MQSLTSCQNLGLGVFEEQSLKNRTPGDRNDAGMPSDSRFSTVFFSSSDSSSSLDDNNNDDNGLDSSSADTESSSEITTSFSAAPRLASSIVRPLPK